LNSAAVVSAYKNVFYCCKKTDVIEFILFNCVLSKSKNYSDYVAEWSAQPTIVQQIQQQQKQGWYEPSVLEIQLMRLCYEGLSSKEIGTYLNLSTRTIDTYITRLAQKLGLRNKIDLIRFAVENGYYNTNI
jgi:DNA-binding NarL/FixJ family response regulator